MTRKQSFTFITVTLVPLALFAIILLLKDFGHEGIYMMKSMLSLFLAGKVWAVYDRTNELHDRYGDKVTLKMLM